MNDTVYTAWRRWPDGSPELIAVYAREQAARSECERLAAMMGGDSIVWRRVPPIIVLSFRGESPFEVHIHEVQP